MLSSGMVNHKKAARLWLQLPTIDPVKIKQRLIEDMDQWLLRFNEGHRNHLGASMIGKPCHRELWKEILEGCREYEECR